MSNIGGQEGMPVGFFGLEMTCAFSMFIEAGHQVDLASQMGGEATIRHA